MQPKIVLDNFQLMGQGATYWLENFDIDKVGAKNVLTSDISNTTKVSTATAYGTGYTNLDNQLAFESYYSKKDNLNLLASTNGIYFFFTNFSTPSSSQGKVHAISNTGSGTDTIVNSSKPSLLSTSEGNILYTSGNHLGIAYRGTANSYSSTTKLVATSVNFSTLGASTSTGSNKFYNVTKKEEYTVTGLTQTSTANDTLTHSAGTAHSDGDEFVLFIDNKWKFNTSSVQHNHFIGQDYSYNWERQIILFGDEYWILNGNYLASLNVDLATFSATAKQLTYKTQATCIGSNNAKMLVGGEYKGAGKLLLWDAYSEGWLSIINLQRAPISIKEYQDGWIVRTGNELIFTNGYQTKSLSKIPDSTDNTSFSNDIANGMEIRGDDVFINVNTYSYNRQRTGVYRYNIINNGWSFHPLKRKDGNVEMKGTEKTAVFNFYESATNKYSLVYSTANSIGSIIFNSTTGERADAIFYVKLPQKMRLNKIKLNLSIIERFGTFLNDDNVSTVYISYGDGRRPIFKQSQISSASTTSSLVNSAGASYPAYLGQEVLMTGADSSSDTYGGERTWITAVTSPTTNSETLTISPALSDDPGGTGYVLFHNLFLCDSKTITSDENINMLQSLEFDIPDFFSDKLWLQVYFKPGTSLLPMSIHSIDIY